MAFIALPNPYSSLKPPLGAQINFGHPLSQGLVGCWLMNEGGGNVLLEISGTQKFISKTGYSHAQSSKGDSLYNDSSTGSANIKYSNLGHMASGKPCSLVWCHYPFQSTISSGARRIFSIPQSGAPGTDSPSIFYNTNNVVTFLYAGSTGLQRTSANNTVQLNAWNTFVFTWDGGLSATGVHFYRNGAEVGYQSTVDGVSLSSPDNYFIIGNRGDLTRAFDGHMLFMFFYNRVLSPSEIQSLYVAPYQFIQAPIRRFYSIPGTVTTKARSFAVWT